MCPAQSSLELRYSGACYDPGTPQSCSYTGSYDIATLTRYRLTCKERFCEHVSPNSREMWYVPVQSPSLCYPISRSFSQPCILLLSFCRPLPRGACNNSTFCQATPDISLSVHSFGTYDPENQLQISKTRILMKVCIDVRGQNYLNYYWYILRSSSYLTMCSYTRVFTGNDIEEFTISNTGGSAVGSCTGGLRSSVVFQCDPNARWEDLPEGNITSYIRNIEHNTTKYMVC